MHSFTASDDVAEAWVQSRAGGAAFRAALAGHHEEARALADTALALAQGTASRSPRSRCPPTRARGCARRRRSTGWGGDSWETDGTRACSPCSATARATRSSTSNVPCATPSARRSGLRSCCGRPWRVHRPEGEDVARRRTTRRAGAAVLLDDVGKAILRHCTRTAGAPAPSPAGRGAVGGCGWVAGSAARQHYGGRAHVTTSARGVTRGHLPAARCRSRRPSTSRCGRPSPLIARTCGARGADAGSVRRSGLGSQRSRRPWPRRRGRMPRTPGRCPSCAPSTGPASIAAPAPTTARPVTVAALAPPTSRSPAVRGAERRRHLVRPSPAAPAPARDGGRTRRKGPSQHATTPPGRDLSPPWWSPGGSSGRT